MTSALLIAALLAPTPSPLERISLLAINAENVSAEELEQLYPVLEKALRQRSGACVVSQHELERRRVAGEKLNELQLCGRPLNEPTPVTHVVSTHVDTVERGYVISLELIDVPRTLRVGGQRLRADSHAALLADLPQVIEALLAGVPRVPASEPGQTSGTR